MLIKISKGILFLSFSLFLMSPSCKKNTEAPEIMQGSLEDLTSMQPKDEIENPIDSTLDLSIPYETLWKRADSLNQLGLYKSALHQVETVYAKARVEKNAPQLVKSLLTKMNLNTFLKEDDYILAINELETCAKSVDSPLKQIIYSIAADVYWGYYEENRYQFMDRSETVNFDNKDIRTWDIKKITDKAYKFYQLSLSEPDLLKAKPIQAYKDMLLVGNTENLRPTLYDFLAHKALDFFTNSETELTRPADRFSVSKPYFFDAAPNFVHGLSRDNIYAFTPDSLSNLLHATQIYFELTQFHLNDSTPDALIDLELRRLNFAKTKSTDIDKTKRYSDALDALAKRYPNSSNTAEINYYRAQFLASEGDSYSQTSPEKQWLKKQAFELCQQTIANFPKSYGAEMCHVLQTKLKEKQMSFVVENAYASKHASKFIFKYKNLAKVYFKIVVVPWDYSLKSNRYNENEIQKVCADKGIHQWEVSLQEIGDYQQHAVEFKLPELKQGRYILLASPQATFSTKNTALALSSFWVSNINYTSRQNNNQGTVDVFVTDRFSGKPIANASVTQYESVYNYTLRKYELVKRDSYVTNSKGLATVAKSKKGNEYSHATYLLIHSGSDQFMKDDAYYISNPYIHNLNQTRTNFFTDRSIYRPGQTIYFKGICLRQVDKKTAIETNVTKTIELYDVNYQKIQSITVTSNEFGTFSGSFTIPTGLLNGSMHIQTADGSHWFSVEEYKRPKFEVQMKPTKGSFKLGSTVSVEGIAKSYAGASIDGAKVAYRVVRGYRYPRWCYYRYWFAPAASADVEITNGEITSKEDGSFKIQFNADQDPSVDSKYMPIYSYQIYIDVTDITGETQSTKTYLNVGAQAMELAIDVPETLLKSKDNSVRILSTNLMGQKLPAKGTLMVYEQLENPTIYRKKRWNQPDLKTFTEEEYRKLFPYDSYDEAFNPNQFKRGKLLGSIPFDTNKSDSISLPILKTLKAGRYQLEAECIDSFGQNVQAIQPFILLDEKSTAAPTQEVFHAFMLNHLLQPGQTCNILIASALSETDVLYEVEMDGQILVQEVIRLNKEQKMIQIPILESYRGNIAVHFSCSRYGDYYNSDFTILVPHSDKILDIEFETFRDKLSPRQSEEWRLKIKGPGGEKVAAELLAAMYDASLDQFAPNHFSLNTFYYNSNYKNWASYANLINSSQLYQNYWNEHVLSPDKTYDRLNWYGYHPSYSGSEYYLYDGFARDKSVETVSISESRGQISKKEKNEEAPAPVMDGIQKNSKGDLDAMAENSGGMLDEDNNAGTEPVQIRSNFNETAFFMPQLKTDAEGNVIIKFTIPESLTKWKFIALAHTKDLKIGSTSKEVVTQKEVMITPYMPRFLREGDQLTLTAKVDNLTDNNLQGKVQLMLFDARTDLPIDAAFQNNDATKTISVSKGSSAAVSFDLQIPMGIDAVKYRFVAKTDKHSDGEENVLPILSNRMLVTESMPMPMKTAGTKSFTFEKLVQSGKSTSIQNHSLSLEYTANPAWYAVQALPYMMEYPYECAEQVFSRYYANSIGSHIIQSNPKIKEIFESWKNSSPDAFLSNLEKNQELKSLILQETPWVLQSNNEQERKKRIALLFDFNKMDGDLQKALDKLASMQVSNGAWPWFKGMEENRYITQHIVTGLGHLSKLGIKDVHENSKTWNLVKKAVKYLDRRLVDDLAEIKKYDKNYQSKQYVTAFQVHYLYARSFFPELDMNQAEKEAFTYFQQQAYTYWKSFDIYNEGMIAIQANRVMRSDVANKIMASLKERALTNDELGMYWKENVTGYYWYQAPIETQALLIEAFEEITKDRKVVNELKVWLLKQKQTTDWKTTKATAEACYVLLKDGTILLTDADEIEISLAGKPLDLAKMGINQQAGTGYFKASWSKDEVKPEMGNITIKKKSNTVSWGALYWQYFEDLDKITPHETPLKLSKKLFVVQNTQSGPVITPITSQTKLKPGDKVRVRIELRSDRNMEYIHMKDMRASGFEPINVFSQYKWQGGLGYYESTKDASTNFFIDFLPKGTYVFEYDLRVTHTGDFSNGITSIQSMYAPEFTSHSEGVRVKVSK